jgi:hypothetical protein
MNKPEPTTAENRSWYREPWPWFLIVLLSTVVIAGVITLWLAASNPHELVISENEYQRVRAELKAGEPPRSDRQDTQQGDHPDDQDDDG